ADSMKRRGHTVALLYSSRTGRSENAWNNTFTDQYSLASASVPHVIQNFNPDSVYFHSLNDLAVLEELLDSGAPVIRRVHDHRMYCMRGGKYNYFTRNVCRRPASWRCVFPCLGFIGRSGEGSFPLKWVSYRAKLREIELNRQCERLVVYSEYQKTELVRNGFDPANIEVRVPAHMNENETAEALPAIAKKSANNILFVGQIIRGKGVDLLLRALAKVRVPFHADVIGEGNHRNYCERLCAALGLTDRVIFHGFMGRAEVNQFYNQASLLAVSSVWPEPFGLVGREAMAHSLPIVAFDAGGIREWLFDGENGFLVPWKDTDAMAARIENLLQDKELARQMGTRGRELMSQQQEASRLDCALEQLLLQAVQRRGRRNLVNV
ncbi:MAG TPA: glycosyltransferase family 4 protein, partial [Verrucomicrobiae bacterium]|nr:glycosyltransferase family 4 protein [Verrucomicrobiae bacterium]